MREFDRMSRQAAQRFGREVEMSFDLSRQILVRRDVRDQENYRVAMPPGCRIDQIDLPGSRRRDAGEIAIRCSANGWTSSYGVHLLGPGLDQWLLVAGLSGDVTEVKDESQLQSMLAPLSAARGARDDTD